MKLSLTLAALAATVTSALPTTAITMSPRADNSSSSPGVVLLGTTGLIMLQDYTSTGLDSSMIQKVSGAPSWMAFADPNRLYAVDEFSSSLRYFHLDIPGRKLEAKTEKDGSAGVVHLEFNKDKTRLVGSAYGNGTVDVWNVEDDDLKLIKTLDAIGNLGPNKVRQAARHPHQAVLDPSGRFFAINDLGTDSIMVLDSKDDAFNFSSIYTINSPGCGPRHGVFYPSDGKKATHYIVVCEMTNQVHVLAVEYRDDTLIFSPVQNLSTFGTRYPPGNATTAAAGEIILSPDNKDVYISNRLTGNKTDSIAHFKVIEKDCGMITLSFGHSVSTSGLLPRMMSFSKDARSVLVGNQAGAEGVVALKRNKDGSLDEKPIANVQNRVFGETGFGPQFVQQIK